jgi:hypothetical protein
MLTLSDSPGTNFAEGFDREDVAMLSNNSGEDSMSPTFFFIINILKAEPELKAEYELKTEPELTADTELNADPEPKAEPELNAEPELFVSILKFLNFCVLRSEYTESV